MCTGPLDSVIAFFQQQWFSNLIQFLSMMGLLFTLILLYRQTKDLRKELTVSTFAAILEQIGGKEAREARGVLRNDKNLNELKNKDIAILKKNDLPSIDEERARLVAVTYDRIAFILKHDPRMRKEILDWHGDVIADMWLRLRPYLILKWRTEAQPRYVNEFEQLGKMAVQMESMRSKKSA